MATTLSTTLSNLLPKFIARAKLRQSEKQVMRSYVDVVQHGSGQGRTYNEPTIGRLTAYPGSEGVAIGQAQALADANTAWTPTEHVVQVVITKRAMFVNREPILNRALEQMTDAMATRKDQQVTALFASATGVNADIGAVNTALATQDVFSIKANVISADDANYGTAPRGAGGQLVFVGHPRSLYDIEADILSFGSGVLGATTPLDSYAADVFKEGILSNAAQSLRGHIAGMLVVQTINLVPDATDDVANCGYVRDAFVCVESGSMDENTDMTQLSGRAVEATMAEWYVAAERTDAWAQISTADAATVS
jgi:hypothetical protein